MTRAGRRGCYDALEVPLVAGRTPLMPVTTILHIFNSADPLQALRETLARDDLMRQAIMVASPTLAEVVEAWVRDGVTRSKNAPLKALAYAARMSTRTTPFGLCAGIGLVQAGQETTLQLVERARTTKTRPDMKLITDLVSSIASGAQRGQVRYRSNDAVLVRGSRLYVTDIRLANMTGSKTEQRPVSMRNTAAVRFVRELCRTPQAHDEIAEKLAERFEATLEDSGRIVDALIGAGVILSEFRVSPIGDPIERVRRLAAQIDAETARRVQHALEAAEALDRLPLRERPTAAYANVFDSCAALTGAGEGPATQIDLHAPFSGTLGSTVLEDAAYFGELFVRMAPTLALKKFRDRFISRYGGRERMVPLLELADANLGLGVPEDLERASEEPPERADLLARLAGEALRTGVEEIVLTDEELAIIAPPVRSDEAPDSIEIAFQLSASSLDQLNRGAYVLAPSPLAGTMAAGRSLGRFMNLLGDEALERARLLSARRNTNDLDAELVYAPPNGRNYNVFIRPPIHDAEIHIGVSDEGKAGECVSPEDLWVGIDGERFFIWSKSRECRVRALESHVLNTSRLTPNICRLLSLITRDGERLMQGFPWGQSFTLPALPRVRYDRFILSPRQWRFNAAPFAASESSAADELSRLRRMWDLPRYLHLRDGDNLLLLDLDSPIISALLHDQIPAGTRHVELREALPAPADAWLHGEDGAYTVELVASLKRRPIERPQSLVQPTRRKPVTIPARGVHGPGSGWLYGKLYVGSQAIEDALLRIVAPLVTELRASCDVDRWFFVRYADPDSHLRVRFHAPEDRSALMRERFLSVVERELTDGHLSRYALETYDPEYERYGGPASMQPVEEFFTTDSDACLEWIARSDHSTDTRIAVAAQSFFSYLIGDSALRALAIETFADVARRKMNESDRSALKRVVASFGTMERRTGLHEALEGNERSSRLASLFHMHCNRIGVTPAAEPRAVTLLRAVAMAYASRMQEAAREAVTA